MSTPAFQVLHDHTWAARRVAEAILTAIPTRGPVLLRRAAGMSTRDRRFWVLLAASGDPDALWPEVVQELADLMECEVPCTLCGGEGCVPGRHPYDERRCGLCRGSGVAPCEACRQPAAVLHDGSALCGEHLLEALELEAGGSAA